MTYYVEGKIIIKVSAEYLANSEEEALEMAKEDFKDDYNLDVHGYNHSPEEVEFKLIAGEYDDE